MLKLICQIINDLRRIREADAQVERLRSEIEALKGALAEAKEREKSASNYAHKYFDAIHKHVPDVTQRWAVIVDVNSREVAHD